MKEKQTRRNMGRRELLRLGGQGAVLLAAGSLLPGAVARIGSRFGASGAKAARRSAGFLSSPAAGPEMPSAAATEIRLVATDGFTHLPGRDPLYVFGFRDVSGNFDDPPNELDIYKGAVQAPAPILWVDQDTDVEVRLTNIGLVIRPDLDDSHTIHWHGFRNATAIFDGVPEVSIAVPVARDFRYYFVPHEEGTYMYHCHFEDVEHVQMGMVGVVFVRPKQNLGVDAIPPDVDAIPPGKYTYNDGDGSTAYDREFALLIQDVWSVPHDNLEAIQETIWSDYDADYWVINGRCYPDPLQPNRWLPDGITPDPDADPSLESQPISSLIQMNPGEVALLRFVNLGYEQHAMELPGIPMTVVGEDATYLGPLPSGRADIRYTTNVVYIGPGESRDVLITAPDHVGLDPFNTYLLKNRNLAKLINPGVPGLGGMATEVRVYPGTSVATTVPEQTVPSQTFSL